MNCLTKYLVNSPPVPRKRKRRKISENSGAGGIAVPVDAGLNESLCTAENTNVPVSLLLDRRHWTRLRVGAKRQAGSGTADVTPKVQRCCVKQSRVQPPESPRAAQLQRSRTKGSNQPDPGRRAQVGLGPPAAGRLALAGVGTARSGPRA